MILRINKFIFSVLLFTIAINLFGCNESMTEVISEGELRKKWDDSVNNSSESWWYAGSEKKYHFIAIKRPYLSIIYQVNDDAVKVEGIKKFRFSDNADDWVNLKMGNIQFRK